MTLSSGGIIISRLVFGPNGLKELYRCLFNLKFLPFLTFTLCFLNLAHARLSAGSN